MPNLNGYDACPRIREQPRGKEVLLIALTGWSQDSDRQRTAEAGFGGKASSEPCRDTGSLS